MRIGIDARLIHETGVGRYIQALINHLAVNDNLHEYVFFVRSLDDVSTTVKQHCESVKADIQWHTFEEQLKMPKIYQQARLDLLHIPYFSVPIFLNIPYVVTIHDLTISHFATGKATTRLLPVYFFKRLGYFLTMHRAVNRAKAVITVSETVRQQILQEYHLPSAKVKVTYESGEIEDISSNEKPPIPCPYLLYVGNAHPHKNVAVLVEAFATLRQDFPHLSLVLVGKQDYFYKELEKQCRKQNLLTGVVFIGEVANSNLISWYRFASAFIFPSLSEGFGIPGLEAMQLDCPVVASDIEVFHEIYQDGAVYFDPKSPTNIAEKIGMVIRDLSLRQKLIKAGKIRSGMFSWAKMTKETLKIYESCLTPLITI